MLRTGDVRMRQFVNDSYLGPAGDDCVDVHFPERDATVFDLAHRHAFQLADQRFGIRAPVRLDERHDYVHALLLELMGVFEHLIRFTYSRRRPDVDAELRPLALLEFGEQRFGRWSAVFNSHTASSSNAPPIARRWRRRRPDAVAYCRDRG